MTQTPEMPSHILVGRGLHHHLEVGGFRNPTEYIRRAVSKEEAGELSKDLADIDPQQGKPVTDEEYAAYERKAAVFCILNYDKIKKLAEAHK